MAQTKVTSKFFLYTAKSKLCPLLLVATKCTQWNVNTCILWLHSAGQFNLCRCLFSCSQRLTSRHPTAQQFATLKSYQPRNAKSAMLQCSVHYIQRCQAAFSNGHQRTQEFLNLLHTLVIVSSSRQMSAIAVSSIHC